MSVSVRFHPPEAIAECRRLYEETDTPNRVIAAKLGIAGSTFGTRVHLWGWRPRKATPRRPREAASAQPPAPAIAADGTTAERIQRTVERELAMIEEIVARLDPPSGNVHHAERAARVLASLTRTMQEVLRLSAPAPNEQNDDNGPADDDEFLKDLARRMDRFARARMGAGVPAGESGAARKAPDDLE